jgi:hypothetical protein
VCHGVRASPLDAPEGSGGGLIGASLQIGERINKEARRWIWAFHVVIATDGRVAPIRSHYAVTRYLCAPLPERRQGRHLTPTLNAPTAARTLTH